MPSLAADQRPGLLPQFEKDDSEQEAAALSQPTFGTFAGKDTIVHRSDYALRRAVGGLSLQISWLPAVRREGDGRGTMSTMLTRNVEAYEPETDPWKIDYDSLRNRGWPASVLDCIKALQEYASHNPMHNLEHQAPQPHLPQNE